MNAFVNSTQPIEPVTRIGRLPVSADVRRLPSMRFPYDARVLNDPTRNTIVKIDQVMLYLGGATWTGDCWIEVDTETRTIRHKVFCTPSCVLETISTGGGTIQLRQDARGHIEFGTETCIEGNGRRFYTTWGAEPLWGSGNFTNHGPIYRFLFVSEVVDLVIPVGTTSITFDGINQGIGFIFPADAVPPTISPELHDTTVGEVGYWDFDDPITITVHPTTVFMEATSGAYCHDAAPATYPYATVEKTITDGTNTMVIPQGDAGNDNTDGGVSLSGSGFTTQTFPYTETVANLITMGWVNGDRLRIRYGHVACGEGAMRLKLPCTLTLPTFIPIPPVPACDVSGCDDITMEITSSGDPGVQTGEYELVAGTPAFTAPIDNGLWNGDIMLACDVLEGYWVLRVYISGGSFGIPIRYHTWTAPRTGACPPGSEAFTYIGVTIDMEVETGTPTPPGISF